MTKAVKCVHPVVGKGMCGYPAGFACKRCGPMCWDHYSDHSCAEVQK